MEFLLLAVAGCAILAIGPAIFSALDRDDDH
jgi:hypothetical protein